MSSHSSNSPETPILPFYTKNDILPFLARLEIYDDKLKDIMTEYETLKKNVSDKRGNIENYQNEINKRLDQKFELEAAPPSDEKIKSLLSIKNSIYYYTGKISTAEQLIISFNLQIDNFDIVGKRASHLMDMVKLFEEYQIPMIDNLNILMSNIRLAQ